MPTFYGDAKIYKQTFITNFGKMLNAGSRHGGASHSRAVCQLLQRRQAHDRGGGPQRSLIAHAVPIRAFE